MRLEGTARQVDDEPPADKNAAFLAKYAERIAAMFGTPEEFSAQFSATTVIRPAKVHV